MKAVIACFVVVFATLCSPAAKAWNCPAGQIRQQAPAGTPTTTPYYDVVEGIAFICVPVTPPTNPTGGNSNASASSSAQSNSTSNASSQSSATGGKSSSVSNATGGAGGTSNATGGSATGGNAVAGVSNSGNSVSTNNNQSSGGAGGQGGNATSTATGGNQRQSQSLSGSGNSTATASGNGVGNGNNSNNSSSVTNVAATKIPVASAFGAAPIPTVTCFKGFGAGVQSMPVGVSFGGGKIDANCAILETANHAPNRLARCKVYITDKYAKDAGVTLEDCMLMDDAPVVPVVEAPASAPVVAPQPIVVNVQPVVVPAPVVNIIAPAPAPSVVVRATPAKPRVPRSNLKCVPRECPTTKPTVWNEDMVEGLQDRNKS
jgi:hypothetical protein